jgi:glycosyltransferase involved in cell wall biosynthesis
LALPDLYLGTDRERRRYLERMCRSADRADMILTDSEASKRDIVEHLKPRSEPIIIYPGSCFAVAARQDGKQSPDMGKHFIYLGGYDRRKGLKQLVRVYRNLYRLKQVRCPLVLVGAAHHDIEAGFGEDIAAGVGEGAIIEKGYVPDDEAVRLLKSSTALIYPSRHEGFGLPVLEAMSVGCPVIATSVSSLPEVCGEAAFYFAPGNDEELAEAIRTLEYDANSRTLLRARGLAQSKKFSWEASARIYLGALEKALSAGRGIVNRTGRRS